MPKTTLEKRVSALEEQVRDLIANHGAAESKGLRGFNGAFTGDEMMKEIFAEGRKIREAERKRARRQNRKSRKARS